MFLQALEAVLQCPGILELIPSELSRKICFTESTTSNNTSTEKLSCYSTQEAVHDGAALESETQKDESTICADETQVSHQQGSACDMVMLDDIVTVCADTVDLMLRKMAGTAYSESGM